MVNTRNILRKIINGPEKNFSQLKYGTKTELEHIGTFNFIRKHPNASNKTIAEHVVSDHMKENPNYYKIIKKNKL